MTKLKGTIWEVDVKDMVLIPKEPDSRTFWRQNAMENGPDWKSLMIVLANMGLILYLFRIITFSCILTQKIYWLFIFTNIVAHVKRCDTFYYSSTCSRIKENTYIFSVKKKIFFNIYPTQVTFLFSVILKTTLSALLKVRLKITIL